VYEKQEREKKWIEEPIGGENNISGVRIGVQADAVPPKATFCFGLRPLDATA
jgi:hypothetical protein